MNMNMINEPAYNGMLPFDTMGLYEPPKPRYIFKMPRVVPNQKDKFEKDDVFRKMSRDCEIRYIGFRDRPQDERKIRFTNACREGQAEISFVHCGINLMLSFNSNPMMYHHHHHHHLANFERELDFDKEHGKVHIKTSFIMNAVCVRFRGWIDLERLDGLGRLEYDERFGAHEDAILQEQLERFTQRFKDFEDSKQNVSNQIGWRQ